MKVTLVGAGPGDRGLLTLRGADRIRNADVVLHDRFVGDEILAMIPKSAEKIDVGKYVGNHPVPQEEINRMLYEKAKEGKNVVRLKGGDPFVFGRGGEELELLYENGIPFEVVPGITSSIAGPAFGGIPVTHRDYASSFHVITGTGKNNEPTNIEYEALVKTDGTLVFLMGVSAIKSICDGCIEGGIDKDMPAAIVENATYDVQRKFVGTVSTLPQIAAENDVQSPAVIIIGKVCELSEKYDWVSKKPLVGKSIIVARATPGTSRLSDQLKKLGCNVFEMPTPVLFPLTSGDSPAKEALDAIDSYSWLIFTSATGVTLFIRYLREIGVDIRKLNHLKIACVGSQTQAELKRRGILTDYCPQEYSGEALAIGLKELVKPGEKLLIARAKDGAEDLTRILSESEISFNDVPIYERRLETKEISIPDTDLAVFTSSSGVEYFAASATGVDITKIKAICIGRRTAQSAKTHGMETITSPQATIESLVSTVLEIM